MKFGKDDIQTFYAGKGWDWFVIGVIPTEQGYYVGTDSGCSCVYPWEYYEGIGDFTGPLTFEQMEEEVTSIAGSGVMSPSRTTELEEFINELR